MIELVGVKKAYRNHLVFEDVNLKIEDGKINYIQGINGVGKSVLLKIICGLSLATEGKVLIDGKELGKEFDIIHNAGVSINNPEFNHNWTGLENLMELAKIRRRIDREGILAMAEDFDMAENMNKKYKSYSLGMKQKLRIMQALMDQPKYLILDEPFDALDQSSKEKTKQILKEYLQTHEDSLLVYTSHERGSEDFADVIFEISENRIVKLKG
ncbi:ATP-binding cassette domain-containing protein [Bulleidia sp. zg-1006]|uniref:ATP-binding cassette domain-containing protein n=1 Tax=Bulleidia sp. zg-1006 TaxID=2806552 RepID=UPI0019398B9D|nr:ABC transporter ATP-binding protein [Bulleidia sp. zg-1006]QRG86810.1 ABC transporter ATP-binding protein [Bulleidia sp. zg-1006]